MTTGGEGGMVTTDNEAMWRRMWAFKDHGKSYEAVYERQHPPGFRWLHETIGTNWRMLEMQAVIGRIQLKRMPDWTARRTANVERIKSLLQPYSDEDGFIRIPDLKTPDAASNDNQRNRHAWYRFYAFVDQGKLPAGWTRDTVIEKLEAQRLPCMQGSCSEIYLEKAFEGTDFRPAKPLPTAGALGETSIMFFTHPGLVYPDQIVLR